MKQAHPGLVVWKTQQEIRREIARMAKEIRRDFRNKDLQIMGILRGVFVFMSDLLRKIEMPVGCHFVNIYYKDILIGDNQVKEIEEAVIYPTVDMNGKTVLLLCDVVDTGIIIDHIRNLIKLRGAASVHIGAVLDKKWMRRTDLKVDYALFEDTEECFVMGYGLDFHEQYRQLPFLARLKG